MFDLKAYQIQSQQNLQEISSTLLKISDSHFIDNGDFEWSPAQHIEHVIAVEKVVLLGLIKAPTELAATKELFGNEKLEKFIIQGMHRKVKSPEIFIPKGIYSDVSSALTDLTKIRSKLFTLLENKSIIPDNRMRPHPYLGNMTMIDWLYFNIHHSNRHLIHIQNQLSNRSAS